MKRFLAILATWLAVGAVAQAAGWGAGCLQPITVGQTISGQLADTDCSWHYTVTPQHQYFTDIYTFSGTAGQQISISLSSPSLNMLVELYSVNDIAATPVAADDNGGGGYNARIPAGSGYFTLPATGTYYIWAQTADPDWTGAYTLALTSASAVPPVPPVTPALPGQVTVTEFYHPQFNHYFITADAAEAASLTAGNIPPWVPTGQTFKVWNASGTNITNVCRFFNNEFSPRSSHFYSNNPAECPGLATRSRWVLELSNAFYMMSSPTGSCPSGTVPLYRLYNNGMSGAPNHRYTAFTAVRSTMIAAGWVPEGNGADGVFACVPPGGSAPPPPPASAFQGEVTGYANTVLGLVSGNIVDTDQLMLILGASLSALETPSSTCPVATSTPPLAGLTTFPPNLTINASFGNGCTVTSGSTQATVAGSVVLTVSNLVLSDSSVSGSLAATFNNVKLNGVLVANGGIQATMNLNINASAESYSGTVAVTLTNLQLPSGLGASGTANIALNSAGTTQVTTNLTTTPNNVAIKLNAGILAQSDGSVLVNTSGVNTVGAYTVQAANLRIDTERCANSPYAGTLSFTKGGQTGTLTFNTGCTYTYSGP